MVSSRPKTCFYAPLVLERMLFETMWSKRALTRLSSFVVFRLPGVAIFFVALTLILGIVTLSFLKPQKERKCTSSIKAPGQISRQLHLLDTSAYVRPNDRFDLALSGNIRLSLLFVRISISMNSLYSF